MLTVLRKAVTGSRRPSPIGGVMVSVAAASASNPSDITSTTTPSCTKNNTTSASTVTATGVHISPSSYGLQRSFDVPGTSPGDAPTCIRPRLSCSQSTATYGAGGGSRFRPGSDRIASPLVRPSVEIAGTAGSASACMRSQGGPDHHARSFRSTATGGNRSEMVAQTQTRWSGGSGGSGATWGWLWTAAAVTAVTAATAAATGTGPGTASSSEASAISRKTDLAAAATPASLSAVAAKAATAAKTAWAKPSSLTLSGCDCGCGGPSSLGGVTSRDMDIGVPPSSRVDGVTRGLVSVLPASSLPSEGYRGLEEGSVGVDLEVGDISGLRGGGRAMSSGAGEDAHGLGAEEEMEEKDGDRWGGKTVPLAERPLFTSVTATKGHRPYMEDEFYVSRDGSFSAVYDGHGGENVSKYLKQNLYRHFMENLPAGKDDSYDLSTVKRALREAYKTADDYVLNETPYANEGSCAVSVTVHCDRNGKASIISCNVGDSRAVLSRGGKAFDLTEDHKPNSPQELERIYRHDGVVTWEGFECSQGLEIEGTGVYRINGNLAVARAIGDIDFRPWVSGEPEIRTIEVNRETDEFVILASDGLWDVMTSDEAVEFVHSVMRGAIGAGKERVESVRGKPASSELGDDSGGRNIVDWTQSYAEDRGMIRAATMLRKKKMARYLTDEALRRGSLDNTTVAVVWLH